MRRFITRKEPKGIAAIAFVAACFARHFGATDIALGLAFCSGTYFSAALFREDWPKEFGAD